MHMSKFNSEAEARHHGEERGIKMGVIFALFLIFLWFFNMSPFSLTTTFILMGLSIVFMKYYGGEMLSKRWEHYDKELKKLESLGVAGDSAKQFMEELHH